MVDLVAEFQRLADVGADQPGEQTNLLLNTLSPVLARRIRLCAIPHQFDAELLAVLEPEIAREEAQRLCEEVARFSVVTAAGDQWAIHDSARGEIFASWLAPAHRPEFTYTSRRLADHFRQQAAGLGGAERETALRQYMYHLLGSDVDAGYAEFARLVRKARHELRFSECAALIRLADDYRPLFSREQQLWLRYYEGKLALDERNWALAPSILNEVAGAGDLPPKLAIAVRLRLAQIGTEARNWESAVPVLEEALSISSTAPHHTDLHARALCELGIAYRELGRYEDARKILLASIDHATRESAWASLATAFDSAGLLHLKQQKPREAIEAFRESLDYLEKANDVFRSADVHDHLGVAYAQLGEWSDSEKHHEQSLRIAHQAGDNFGRAAALNNLARVHASQGKLVEAVDAVKEAVGIFDALKDPYAAAQARQNLGKYLLRAGDRDAGRQSLLDSASAFDALGKRNEGENVRRDIANLEDPGLPWWAWVAIAVAGLFVLLVTAGALMAP